MADPAIKRLCQDIYRDHRKTLDLIYRHRPNPLADVTEVVPNLIQENTQAFVLAREDQRCNFTMIAVKRWGNFPALISSSSRVLILVLDYSENHVRLSLQVGPGDAAVRQRLFKMAEAHQPPFHDPEATASPLHTMIYKMNLLEPSPVPLGIDDIGAEVRRNWADFMAVENGEAVGDFRAIGAVIEAQEWLRAPGANGT